MATQEVASLSGFYLALAWRSGYCQGAVNMIDRYALAGCMGFVWVRSDLFLPTWASPFHLFVTID